MKKLVIVLMLVVVVLSLCACTNGTAPKETIPTIEKEIPLETKPLETTTNETTVPTATVLETQPPVTTVPETTQSTSSGSGIREEFKEAMDAYEAFYDEYCTFMNKYKENPTDFTLLAQYLEMVKKAEEMDKAFEKWDEDEMSNKEIKYYLDVSNRITQKLLDVAS